MSAATETIQLGYLGPEGSHSHGCASQMASKLETFLSDSHAEVILTTVPSLHQLIRRTGDGSVDYAIVPVENALEGSVIEVMEAIGGRAHEDTPIQPVMEMKVAIRHALISKSRTPDAIHKIISHPQAIGQCRQKLIRRYGSEVELKMSASTSEAVKLIKNMDVDQADHWAALGSKAAAEQFGLTVLDEDMSDGAGNQTRFLLITGKQNNKQLSLPAGSDISHKTAFCFTFDDRPGALVDTLLVFKNHGVNMTRIESRPSKKKLGDYVFYVDANVQIENSETDPLVQALKETTSELTVAYYVCLDKTD